MVTVFSVLITVFGMLGVTVLKEYFDNERQRLDHRRSVKLQAINEFQTIINEMISMPVRYKAAADSGDTKLHAQSMAAYSEVFMRARVSIEALEPSKEVIDDLNKASKLVFALETRYIPEEVNELNRLTVLLKKHHIELNEKNLVNEEETGILRRRPFTAEN